MSEHDTQLDLAAIKARHQDGRYFTMSDPYCRAGCGQFPCDAYRLAEEVERLRGEIDESRVLALDAVDAALEQCAAAKKRAEEAQQLADLRDEALRCLGESFHNWKHTAVKEAAEEAARAERRACALDLCGGCGAWGQPVIDDHGIWWHRPTGSMAGVQCKVPMIWRRVAEFEQPAAGGGEV